MPETWWEYSNLAIQAYRDNDFETAEKYYLKTIELNPNYAPAYNNLANIYHEKLHENEKAETFYRKAISLNPNVGNFYVNLGMLFYAFGNIEDAEKLFREAIKVEPNFGAAYHSLGCLLYKKGKVDEGLKYLYKAIDDDKIASSSRLVIASILKKLGRMDEANKLINSLESVIEKDNYRSLASLNAIKGNKSKSFENLKLAVKENPHLKLMMRHSLTLEVLQDDERFWEIVGKD